MANHSGSFGEADARAEAKLTHRRSAKIRKNHFRRLYEAAKPFVLATLGLMAVLVLLEFLTRVADYVKFGAPLLQNYNEDSLFSFDALGKHGRPFARYRKWQLDSQGYRGPEIEKDKIHIICIGSSETFGLYEAPDQEYPRQLERDLNEAAGKNNYQVVNVAFPGQTLNTARARIPGIVASIHPQYALIYPSVAFYIWLPWTIPAPPPPVASPQVEDARFEWRIAEAFHQDAKQYLPPAFQNWLREVQNRRDARKFGVEMDRVPDENVARLKSDLTMLLDELRSFGVQPVLVTHASRFGQHVRATDRYFLTGWRRIFPMMKENGFLDTERRMNAAIREVATERGVPLIDVAKEMPSGSMYFGDHQHFTTLGAQVMAEKLTAGLLPILELQAHSGSGGTATASISREGAGSSNPALRPSPANRFSP